jgi:hypothetical protein
MRIVICLQIPRKFWIGGRTISLLLNVHRVSDVRETEIHTGQPLVPDPFEVEIAIAMLRKI